MFQIIRKKISITFFLSSLLLLSSQIVLSAELNSKSWEKYCDVNNNCLIGINKNAAIEGSGNEKLMIISSAYIQIQNSKDSTDKKEIIFSVDLPLGSDLKSNPLLQIDNINIGNLEYRYCNSVNGCRLIGAIDEIALKSFKDGIKFTIIFSLYGQARNIAMSFPLKGFTKAYEEL